MPPDLAAFIREYIAPAPRIAPKPAPVYRAGWTPECKGQEPPF
jgi:hypothetical protein